MKYILILAISIFFLNACKKSDGNALPTIKFKSITNLFDSKITTQSGPFLVLKVKDADGDFGVTSKDTSFVFIKNVSTPPFKMDSVPFPSNLTGANIKNNEFELEIDLSIPSGNGQSVLAPLLRSSPSRDTMYFEVFVKDFKRNKSNIIKTDEPLIYIY